MEMYIRHAEAALSDQSRAWGWRFDPRRSCPPLGTAPQYQTFAFV